ncbi:MAG: hypothetical protein FIB00_05520 [Chloroflexi bacterium]|nr:hypothetical protein [Chloroflexota bacterium]
MTLSRRTALKLGIGAGALPLLGSNVLADEPPPAPPAPAGGAVIRARPLPLTAVRLTGGPLKRALDLNSAYLLALEPDRMLSYFRQRAGLQPKAEGYGGWDGGGRNLTGHIAGHYLSAISYMYAATGDPRFKERVDYMVADLKEVQDANQDGNLVALENGKEGFAKLARGEMRSGSFDLNGMWSPGYSLHKLYAGLRDAYRFTGNKTALQLEVNYGKWAENILKDLDDTQLQFMMNTEFGGMNEVAVDLYADTGDPRWLKLAEKFEHRVFIEPLKRNIDNLGGCHGNTAVPKIMGNIDRYLYTGSTDDYTVANFFWNRVAQHHSFATGGHGKDEYFAQPDKLSVIVDGRTAESCNIYNMLKLTRLLFSIVPDPQYADFHERALFNHVMASIDPEDGRTCYMVPVGRGVTHEYQDMQRGFTCCVGSGMESHALHGDGIYYEADDRLWVNLYAPSTAQWAAAGVTLTAETEFPEGETAKLSFQVRAPKEFTLLLRRPWWAGDTFAVKVNGQAFPVPTVATMPIAAAKPGMELAGRSQYTPYQSSRYVELKRTWRTGDVVEVTLPKSLRLAPTPDNPRRASIMWGPLVLAGDLGPEPQRTPGQPRQAGPGVVVPVLVSADRPVGEWVQPVAGSVGKFRTAGVGREPNAGAAAQEVDLAPFFRVHRRTYATYWDLYTPAEWEAKKAEYVAEAERVRKLEAASIAVVQPGDQAGEAQFGYQGTPDAQVQRMLNRAGRRAGSWFSYDLPVDASKAMALIATYYSDDRRGMPADFEILVDGQRIAETKLERNDPPRFFDTVYPLPAGLVQGKQKVTVKFQAKTGSQVATIFGLRVVKADELK